MTDIIANLRTEVMAVPEGERLGYAIDLLEFFLAPVPEFYSGCYAMGLRFTARDTRLLHALDRQRGRFLSIEGLQAALEVDRRVDDWVEPGAITKRISVMRARFKKSEFPVTITNWSGVGYKLDAPADFRFENVGRLSWC